ncbi:MAG: hypothetical protein WAU07_03795, partial [Microgenomates group bacterium]
MQFLQLLLSYFAHRKKILPNVFRASLIIALIFSQTLLGLPIDFILNTFFISKNQNFSSISTVHANSATYDFGVCGSTCDTDTGWHASGDDVDIFPFAGSTANRNTHTEVADADYTNLASSDNARYAPTNPSTADQNLLWLEMTVSEDPATITKLDFTFEGYTTTTASPFFIYIKTDAGAYEDTASWTILSGGTTIAGSTETTIV